MTERGPTTPDGRYFIVAGRLWRASNPAIPEVRRRRLVEELMEARRGVREAKAGKGDLSEARAAVDAAKIALGERGMVCGTTARPTTTAEWRRIRYTRNGRPVSADSGGSLADARPFRSSRLLDQRVRSGDL